MKKNKGLIIVICIAITLIVIINAICVFVACCPELINELFDVEIHTHMKGPDRVESSIISTGLSIIGIAVAVWTGLNIANTIDKNRIDEIDERIKAANCQMKEIKETVDTISDVRKKQVRIDKSKLLQEMYLSESDMATRKLIKLIEDLPNESTVPFMELLAIEQEFRIVLNSHESKYTDNAKLKKIAEHGIKLAEDAVSNTKDNIARLYLNYRIADFHFYMGYCCLGKECASHFLEAIKWYRECADDFQADIPQFGNNEIGPNMIVPSCKKIKEISAYFCNSIGEAYSKIVHNNKGKDEEKCSDADIKLYGSQAVFYCAYAIHWGNKTAYIRNYGCALERHYGKQIFVDDNLYKVICSEYETAIKREPENISNFKNMVSAYDKYVNNILSIKSIHLPNRRNPPLGSAEFVAMWQKDDRKQEVITALESIRKLAHTIKTLFPGDGIGYQYACIYFRDMCAIYGNHTLERDEAAISQMKQTASRYLEQAEENWSVLNIVSPYDPDKPYENPMTQILRNDLDDLKKLF